MGMLAATRTAATRCDKRANQEAKDSANGGPRQGEGHLTAAVKKRGSKIQAIKLL